MREAINTNPMVQIGLLSVLAIAAAFMLLGRGGEEAVPASPATADEVAANPADEAVTPAVPTEPGTAPEPAKEGGKKPVSDPALEPGPGLPKKVSEAYARGEVVAILFYKRAGIADHRLRRTVNRDLGSRASVALFIERPKHVAKFAQITRGVALNRTPALIVIKPKSASNGTPVASVQYGFRGSKSVEQTIRDALYDGKRIPFHP